MNDPSDRKHETRRRLLFVLLVLGFVVVFGTGALLIGPVVWVALGGPPLMQLDYGAVGLHYVWTDAMPAYLACVAVVVLAGAVWLARWIVGD
ncbi:MAG: hypothetical protein K9L70_12410 [Thiohalocapsa sp.]|nr:hypothetical protein [Thiohalocapsa sp.]MCF7992241.1 hypothetical protein [Thiohalocapsa sp.]